jgi:hypothetical protein
MKTTNIDLWLYRAQFGLERKMFQTKGLENTKHILCPVPFFSKIVRLRDNVEKYYTAGRVTDGIIIRRIELHAG